MTLKRLPLKPTSEIAALPGQFVGIAIKDGKGSPWYRSYSLLADEQGNMQICVKKVPAGRGSNYLHTLKVNDQIDIIAPLGYFGFPKKLTSNLLFIATGTGIVPILSLLENLPKDFNGTARLIFGVRHEQDLFYQDRIQIITKKQPNYIGHNYPIFSTFKIVVGSQWTSDQYFRDRRYCQRYPVFHLWQWPYDRIG